MDDIRAVMDAVVLTRAAMFGLGDAGPLCVLFAATYPERTSGPCCSNSAPRFVRNPELPWLPTRAQCRSNCMALAFELGARLEPGKLRVPDEPWRGVEQHQGRRALWVGRGKEHAQWTGVAETEHRGASGAHGVHHGADVVHARLERRYSRDAVRHADSALVEEDQAAGRGEPTVKRRRGLRIPRELQVADRGSEDQVRRAGAELLIGDRHFAGTGVAGFRDLHGRREPSPRGPFRPVRRLHERAPRPRAKDVRAGGRDWLPAALDRVASLGGP